MKVDQFLSKLTPQATISQIISANNKAGELLASIGLSVSEHKDQTLRSVCQQQKWSEAEVLDWVKKQISATNGESVSKTLDLSLPYNSDLSDWTKFVSENFVIAGQFLLEELSQSFPRVLKIHGNQYTWLKNMQWYFDEFKEALSMYYEFEQKKFFPLIEQLSKSKKSSLNHGAVQKLVKSFTIIERDQDRLRRQMTTIRKKGNEFKNPGNACSTFRIQNKNFTTLFSKLKKQFEIENDHLIPHIKKELQA